MRRLSREIASFLEDSAKTRTPIFYSDLSRKFGLPPVTDAWTSHPLRAIFGELDLEDQEQNRPFRTALVIAKETSIPGNGFFTAHHDLRGISVPKNEMKRMEL
jgi:hypothetical protein